MHFTNHLPNISLRAADQALAAIERGEDELVPWEQVKREMREERQGERREEDRG